MSDLVKFLTARLDEDEAAASAAEAPSPWKAADHESDTWIVTDAAGEPLIYDEGTPSLAEAAHIARHDPARVLRRQVPAMRAILGAYESQRAARFNNRAVVDELRDVVQTLASVYSDHPDYQQEWKP